MVQPAAPRPASTARTADAARRRGCTSIPYPMRVRYRPVLGANRGRTSPVRSRIVTESDSRTGVWFMPPFNVNSRPRLAEVLAALPAARQENRLDDAVALELAARLLERHVGEIESKRPVLV